MQNSIGFNLTSLSDEKLTVERIERFNEIIFAFFSRHDIEPTYWGVSDKNLSSKLQKFTFKKLENLKKRHYIKGGELLWGLNYVINPKDSDAPAFDDYFYISLGYAPPLKRLEISLAINPNIIPVTKEEIGEFFIAMAKLFIVDFGFIYEHESFEHVSAVVLNYDDEKYTEEEYEVENWWYALPREEKLKHPRGLFGVNLLRRELYAEAIEKMLNSDREFFKFYHYKGKGFIEHPLPDDLAYLSCLIDKAYTEYCD
jgi:hypothetical protein